MMTIGEFALHMSISVKALHFYNEREILPPAEVDPSTWYRFYATAQLQSPKWPQGPCRSAPKFLFAPDSKGLKKIPSTRHQAVAY